jgi:hypothetical protein
VQARRGARAAHACVVLLTGKHWYNKVQGAMTSITPGPRQSPQTNGICECFHKTILHEFYQATFRKKLYGSLEELQQDLDVWRCLSTKLSRALIMRP